MIQGEIFSEPRPGEALFFSGRTAGKQAANSRPTHHRPVIRLLTVLMSGSVCHFVSRLILLSLFSAPGHFIEVLLVQFVFGRVELVRFVLNRRFGFGLLVHCQNSRSGTGDIIRYAMSADYGSGMPIESSPDGETELRATEWLSPYCMLINSKPIRNSRMALATAMIEICLPVKIKF
jgi:hypothetical protein